MTNRVRNISYNISLSIKIIYIVISWLRWVLQLFGKLIPLPANKATKVHKVAWREEEASITWQRFSFQPKWGNFSLCCCGAQRLKSIASRSTLFLASVADLEYVRICNPASVQASLRCQLLCAKLCSQVWNYWKIFIDVNKCFDTESPKRKIFCKLKSACSLLWTFPPTFNEGISFFREKLNVQKLYFLEYFISFNS